jgi:YVTN family beta-propeller protein
MNSSTIALSGDDRTLVAINQDDDSVSIFDASTDALPKLAEISVGGEPRSVAVLPNGTKAYVANATSGTVSVIHLASRAVIATVAVGVEPRAVVSSPSGTRVYVANSVSNTVSVIDTSSDTVTATVEIPANSGTHPRALAITSNGDADDLDEKLFVALFFAELRPGKTGAKAASWS